MTENRKQILEMLAQGKINVEEAERLLSLLEQPPSAGTSGGATEDRTKSPAKYLRVVVEPDKSNSDAETSKERVNIRVPMGLLRAGVKLAALIPSEATDRINKRLQEKGIGIDVGNLKGEDLEQLIEAIADIQVDVQDGKQQVRVFVE